MWLPWLLRSRSRAQKSLPSNFDFRCSSFRDVESLCEDDDDEISGSEKPPHSPVHRSSLLRRVRISASVLRAWSSLSTAVRNLRSPPDAHNRVVVYYTSLRVIRRTYEDCRAVRSILKSFRVKIDERDLSMDCSYQAEVHGILSSPDSPETLPLALPRVFIDGRYVGGAEEIKTLHESGDLKRMIERLPLESGGECDVCGGHRFVLCKCCSGSHKVYSEECSGFKMCDSCNQNGLIKCTACTSVHF